MPYRRSVRAIRRFTVRPVLPEPLTGLTTLAGNLTLVGSVANLIVFETARGRVELSFLGYLRVGVPVTLLSFALGLAVLLAEHALF